MARGRTTTNTLALLLPVGAITSFVAGDAEAATPTYYNNLVAFQADVTSTVTDDYQNPAYVFNQSNAVMSAVLGQTDYMTTGFADWNLVVGGGHYCAGCNGSFELQFQTTTVGNAVGVNGAGFDIASSDNTYYAYITFGDGTTANIQLPPAGTFWGVAAPERVERIHIGLSNGMSTTGGYFEMDNLIVGDGNIGGCMVAGDCVDDMNPCTDATCQANFCVYVPNVAPCDDGNMCTDDVCSGGLCTGQFNASPCDDGEVCTENDVCAVGLCQGSLLDCSDGNECTTDFCDFGVGCSTVANDAPCDDGNVCTEKDACSGGTCEGSATSCSDDDPCTADSCDPELGCVSDPIPGCCDGDEDCGADQVCDLDTSTCVDIPGGSSSEETGTPADTGMPADTGVDDTGGSGGGSAGASDSGGLDTGSTGSTGPADTGIPLDSGELPTPGGSGCGCTTTPSPQGRLWWLMLPVGLVLRRRRRVA
jgi:MYXO-CTERM domain-containing protein